MVLEVNRNGTAVAVFEAVFRQTGIFAGVMDLSGHLRDASELSLKYCGYSREQTYRPTFLGNSLVARLG